MVGGAAAQGGRWRDDNRQADHIAHSKPQRAKPSPAQALARTITPAAAGPSYAGLCGLDQRLKRSERPPPLEGCLDGHRRRRRHGRCPRTKCAGSHTTQLAHHVFTRRSTWKQPARYCAPQGEPYMPSCSTRWSSSVVISRSYAWLISWNFFSASSRLSAGAGGVGGQRWWGMVKVGWPACLCSLVFREQSAAHSSCGCGGPRAHCRHELFSQRPAEATPQQQVRAATHWGSCLGAT